MPLLLGLSGVVLPADVAAGSSVEIIAQATDATGQTYVQTLDDVSVIAPPSFHGGHLLGELLGH